LGWSWATACWAKSAMSSINIGQYISTKINA
jgi:hypothetical protein